MSLEDRHGGEMPAEPAQLAQWIVTAWVNAFAGVVETMTGDRPTGTSAPAGAIPSSDGWAWYAQSFNIAQKPAIWAGSASSSWSGLGSYLLAALGVNEASEEEIQATCQDVLAQVTSSLAQSLTAELGEEVTGGNVMLESGCSCEGATTFSVSINAGLTSLNGTVSVAGELLKYVQSRAGQDQQPEPHPEDSSEPDQQPACVFQDLRLRVRVVLGRARLPLRDVFKLNVGSVVELDRNANDLADLMTGDQRLGRGEIVIINGDYGIKLTEIRQKPQQEGRV